MKRLWALLVAAIDRAVDWHSSPSGRKWVTLINAVVIAALAVVSSHPWDYTFYILAMVWAYAAGQASTWALCLPIMDRYRKILDDLFSLRWPTANNDSDDEAA